MIAERRNDGRIRFTVRPLADHAENHFPTRLVQAPVEGTAWEARAGLTAR